MLQEHDSRALYERQVQNIDLEEQLLMVKNLQPKFSKDGNQFCYLYGENLQEGIAGFGYTPAQALRKFYEAFMYETIHEVV